jgi:molybdopterin synthase catalytic subunit
MTTIEHNTNFFISVSETLPSLDDCYQFVTDDSCGAVATFVGTTRNTFEGKTVAKLIYEVYVPMANNELHKLCTDTCLKYPGILKIAAAHIIGDCPVGSPSVILAVSSPHRRDSLRAIEYLIDKLKARIPIWKSEVYEGEDGVVWKENIEWHEGKQRRIMVKKDHTNGSRSR